MSAGGLRTAATLLAIVLLVAAGATAVRADRETAEYFAKRGDKALAGDDHDEALDAYRRALGEDEHYLPARLGVARALLASDSREEGLAELRALVALFDGADVPKEWRKHRKAATSLLEDVDAAGANLAESVRKHCDELVAFARKWRKKDEDAAVAALRTALRLLPGHAAAATMIEELGHSAKGPPREMFDGTLNGWIDMGPPDWQVQDGAIVGQIEDAGSIGRTVDVFEGDFDVSVEMRQIEEYAGPSLFVLAPTYDGRESHYSFGLIKGRFSLWEKAEGEEDRTVFTVNPPNEFDETEWHRYELRFRGDRVQALVDGKSIGLDRKRPPERRGGFVGLKVQNVRAAFRNVIVTPR